MEKIDKDNMYGSIWDFPENIVEAIGLGKSINLKNKYSDINKIIVAGMGGSAIGGDVVYSLIGDEIKIPYFVIRGYNIPSWVDSSTLVICSSYSGNTEETIEILEKAKSVQAKICAITTGGRLEQLCEKHNFEYMLSATEYGMKNCFLMLNQVILELKKGKFKPELWKWRKRVDASTSS